ncbi:MAG: hypothetical protein AAFV53_21840, partial [Myxococcota bacterium]
MVIVVDDVGLDKVGGYGLHPFPANTPVINALAEQSVRFWRVGGKRVQPIPPHLVKADIVHHDDHKIRWRLRS